MDELSESMRGALETTYATWKEPPPLDDDRPDETSWTYFKKIIDQKTQD